MPTTLQPPPTPAPLPRSHPPMPHRWTVSEFHRLNSLGLFAGRRPFLLDGVIWEQGPMDTPHATGLTLVDAAVRPIFGSGWILRIQMPLHVDEPNDPFPDLAVVPGGLRDYLGNHPTSAALVIEVSDSTLGVDTTEKAERYATAGVADYWVLDIPGRRLLVFRDPAPLPTALGATAYRTHLTLAPTDRVSPLAAPHASVLVADLLP